MEDREFKQRVSELEQRVSSLESQVNEGEERTHFERRISNSFPKYADIDYREGRYGCIAWVSGVGRDDATEALEELEDLNCGSSINETSEGLKVEVWSKQDSESEDSLR